MFSQVIFLLCFAFSVCRATSQNRFVNQMESVVNTTEGLKADLLAERVERQRVISNLSLLVSKVQELDTKLQDCLDGKVSGQVNIALYKPATQSSTWSPGDADRAVDGRKDIDWNHNSCSHTDNDVKAWWGVDLGDIYRLERVVITRRNHAGLESRVANFKIDTSVTRESNGRLVYPNLCFYEPNAQKIGSTKSYNCGPETVGRYVRIQLQGQDYLTLCEVEVYGERSG